MKTRLLTSVVLLAAVFFGASASGLSPEGTMPRKEVGLQLYSVRSLIGSDDKMAGNLPVILDSLAAMGYTQVETANYSDGKFYGLPAAEFRKICEERGLQPLSSHTSKLLTPEQIASGDFSEALKWWEQSVAAHKEAGMEYIVCPWTKVKSKEELDAYCRFFNQIGEIADREGLKFGYHNHAHEFEKINDVPILDYMIQHTDPEKVFFQLDVYWSMMGKASAVEYFKKYPGRFRLLHIKDKLEVGQSGMVGFDAIFRNAGVAGVENIIVEAEGSSYGDLLRTMRESIDYLLEAPFVKSSYRD